MYTLRPLVAGAAERAVVGSLYEAGHKGVARFVPDLIAGAQVIFHVFLLSACQRSRRAGSRMGYRVLYPTFRGYFPPNPLVHASTGTSRP
jgi:hypothetical protein